MKNGFSGNIAKGFLQSKLTILLMIAFLLIGGYSTFLIPREEEPQIKVPMADIFIGYPGAEPKDVETKGSCTFGENDLQCKRCGICIFYFNERPGDADCTVSCG